MIPRPPRLWHRITRLLAVWLRASLLAWYVAVELQSGGTTFVRGATQLGPFATEADCQAIRHWVRTTLHVATSPCWSAS